MSAEAQPLKIPLWLRAAAFFLIAPFPLVVVVPEIITGDWSARVGVTGRVAAIALFATGLAILVWCFRDFVVRGRGTPAPYDPPRALVVQGLYRFTRNPMYLGIVIALLGEAIWTWSGALLLYAALVGLAFHLRVVIYEEPKLTELFGDEFGEYRGRVRRWL